MKRSLGVLLLCIRIDFVSTYHALNEIFQILFSATFCFCHLHFELFRAFLCPITFGKIV